MSLLPLEPLFVRRVALLCCHFARNVAYYRIGYVNENGTGGLKQTTQFGATVNGNMIDIAVLEWCKLFADRKGQHRWNHIVRTDAEQKQFLAQLFPAIGITDEGWKQYVEQMRAYRDNFIAHLDANDEIHVPTLETALRSAFFLYEHMLAHAPAGTFNMPHRVKLPLDLQAYYAECQEEARAAYEPPK